MGMLRLFQIVQLRVLPPLPHDQGSPDQPQEREEERPHQAGVALWTKCDHRAAPAAMAAPATIWIRSAEVATLFTRSAFAPWAIIFLALAVTGHAILWMAILADTGATLVVIANALRLLRA